MQTYPEKFSKQKSSKKRHRVLFKELCSDFSKNTSLHGLKYINESGRTIVEKTFWLMVFVASVAYCGYQIRNVWTKWSERPVIVSFSEKMVPVGMVPFPSVTICPQRKISQAKYNFSAICEQNDTLERDQAHKLDDISLLCEGYCKAGWIERNTTNETLVQNILEALPDISDVFFVCMWRGEDCNGSFNEVLTNQGVCYNFNSISANEMFHENSIQHKYSYLKTTANTTGWSLKDGYIDEKDPYPRRGRPNGAIADLSVVLRSKSDEDDLGCNSINDGFKIYVHHPTDFPQATLYSYAALFDQQTSMALKFNKISTSDAMYAYNPDVRQCYFQEDKPLKYFKVYTQHNCVLECSANHTFRECGCVDYYMPHDNPKEICPYAKKNCVNEAIDKMAALELSRNGGECACLPACDSVTYDAEILKTQFNFDRYLKSIEKLLPLKMIDSMKGTSAIEIYFKEPQFVSMRRSELFGVTDFISNCGGLLSLFLGFSILSLVEIVYYVTMRFFCILRKDSKRSCEENGKEENEKQN